MLAEIAPVVEQLDGGSLVVGKREHLTDAGRGIIAQLAAHAVFRKLLCKVAEIGIWRDFKRELDTVGPVRLVQRNHQLPDLGREIGTILFPLGQHQPQEFFVVRNGLVEIRRLEGGVANASCLDHGVLLGSGSRTI